MRPVGGGKSTIQLNVAFRTKVWAVSEKLRVVGLMNRDMEFGLIALTPGCTVMTVNSEKQPHNSLLMHKMLIIFFDVKICPLGVYAGGCDKAM